jgi:hypothetical protein
LQNNKFYILCPSLLRDLFFSMDFMNSLDFHNLDGIDTNTVSEILEARKWFVSRVLWLISVKSFDKFFELFEHKLQIIMRFSLVFQLLS